jgi:hypothetical protein
MTRENSVAKVGERIAAPDAKEIDRTLRRLAQAQSALDADEMHWLRVADAHGVWPHLGYVHALEYLEDVFGYAPRTALERLRVARELGELPQLEDTLRVGELSYSAVRELSRVATPETIETWLDAAKGLRFRDVERMVAGRKKGDGPDAKPDPALVKHRVVLELDGESLAIWRQMRQVVELELEQSLDDRSLVLAVGERLLGGRRVELGGEAVGESSVASSVGEAKSLLERLDYMIHIITCRECGGTWQDGGGVRVPIGKSVLERARCDALVCDDEQGERATRTIPLAVRRQALERAQHRCQVPGCRSSKHLRIHHVVFRSVGGRHELWNLVVLCDGHHRVLHDGHLTITGRAPDELVFTRNGTRMSSADRLLTTAPAHATHVVRRHTPQPPRTEPTGPTLDEDNVSLARMALVQLGFTNSMARRAVELAQSHVRADTELAELIKGALQHCS